MNNKLDNYNDDLNEEVLIESFNFNINSKIKKAAEYGFMATPEIQKEMNEKRRNSYSFIGGAIGGGVDGLDVYYKTVKKYSYKISDIENKFRNDIIIKNAISAIETAKSNKDRKEYKINIKKFKSRLKELKHQVKKGKFINEEIIGCNLMNEQVKLNESIMYKSGMNLLVEETMIEDSINNNIDVLTESVIGEIKAIDELSRADIIEFRNKPIISKLSNVNVFIAEAMTAFKPTIFNTTILFEDAIEVAKKFSIVLGEDISYKDIYNGASLTTINEQLFVNYKTANLGLIDRYKNNLTRKAEICNECLFGDLFDADILTENLPVIIVSELNIK